MSRLSRAQFAAVIARHRITYGVVGALAIGMLLTAVSLALYVSSGASRLDLSRPGYEHVRSEVQQDTDKDTFSSTGAIDETVVKDFRSRLDRHRDTLSKLDTYGTDALDDDQLQIAPSTTATPASDADARQQ